MLRKQNQHAEILSNQTKILNKHSEILSIHTKKFESIETTLSSLLEITITQLEKQQVFN